VRMVSDDEPTSFVPSPTVPAPELAWSQDEDSDRVYLAQGIIDAADRESWATTWAAALVFLVSGIVLAIAVGFGLWAELQHHDERLIQPIAPRIAQ
jgi:hypothetical protein